MNRHKYPVARMVLACAALAGSAQAQPLAVAQAPESQMDGRSTPAPERERAPSTQKNTPADSATADTPPTLFRVTIVGNWLNNPSSTTVFGHPGTRDLIIRDQFQAQGATTIREVLTRIPGLNAPENNGTGSHDMALNLGVRGLNPRLAGRSTVLIDGIPLPFAPYGQPQLSFSAVSLGNLDAIDVVRGGATVRYGPQNVGGIINFVTRRIPKNPTATFNVQTAFMPNSAQTGGKTTASTLLGGTLDNGLGVALLYSGVRGGDWRARSGTKIDDLMLKMRFDSGPHAFNAMAQRYEGRADMPGGLSVANYQRDPYQSTRPWDSFWGHRNLLTVGYDYEPDTAARFSVKAFRTETLRSGYLDQGAFFSLSPRSYTVDGIETRFSRGFGIGESLHEIGVGHRYVRESSREWRYRLPASGNTLPTESSPLDRKTHGYTRANAFFIDDRITYGPWVIVPGVRVERISSGQINAFSSKRDAGNYTAILPALNVTYALNEQWNLYANTDTSFGTLQYSKMKSAVTSGDVAPEKGRSWELGTRYDNDGLLVSAGLFAITFSNQYESNQQTNSVYARGKTRHQGLEANVAYELAGWHPALSGFSAYANYAYVDARILEEGPNKGNQVPFSSRHKLVMGLDYRQGPWKLGVDGSAQSGQFSDNRNTSMESPAGNNGRIPGHMVWGLHGSHAFGSNYKDLTLGVGVRNVFGKRYFTRSFDDNNRGIYVGQPRTLYLQASMKF
ncbi:TonB-dependent siderophore receptor [Lysobacter pythonis]|uniref:TonB-dependent siderophore receptor n=1 Tax=Solilutibacter pythonis TaxID=2483112 RepID=A0A3M2I452_9GAMM|nr:TonB-dependent siderophore receptor [Lysobacter pythonis]RMH92984.1 TonB-dependent siderophore receptor [Lysobacter pythonis]